MICFQEPQIATAVNTEDTYKLASALFSSSWNVTSVMGARGPPLKHTEC